MSKVLTETQRAARAAYAKSWAAANAVHRAEYMRSYRIAHRAELLVSRRRYAAKKAAAAHAARRLRNELVYAARAGGCVDCGITDQVVLQSDHVRGEKVSDISRMVAALRPMNVLLAELDKCETRCANCHARATSRRRKEA